MLLKKKSELNLCGYWIGQLHRGVMQ